MIIRNERNEYVGIRCDTGKCKTMAPPASEILKGHGLINMGWHCSGGIHYCPDHNPNPRKPAAEQPAGGTYDPLTQEFKQ